MDRREFLLGGAASVAMAGDALAQFNGCPPGFCPGLAGGGQPVLGPYVPTTNLAAVAGIKRLNAGYNGPLFQLTRASDNATQDFAAVSGDWPDTAAITAFIGGSSARYSKIYYQDGSGSSFAQATFANMPAYSALSVFKGRIPIAFNANYNTTTAKFLGIPASLVLARNAYSAFFAVNPRVSLQNNIYWEFNDGVSAAQQNIFTAGGAFGLRTTNGGVTNNSLMHPRAQPNVIGLSSGGANQTFYAQGRSETKATVAAASMATGGFIGKSILSNVYNQRGDMFGWAFYNAALNATDSASVVAALNGAFNFDTSFTARVILDGDSLLEGWFQTESLETWTWQMEKMGTLKGTPEIFNLGIGGQPLCSNVADTTTPAAVSMRGTATNIQTLINGAGGIPVVYSPEGGTNDIAGVMSAANMQANFEALVATVKGYSAAVKIAPQNILPRAAFTVGNGKETIRTTQNSYLAGLVYGAYTGDGLSNVAMDPTIGPTSATAVGTLYYDGTHLTPLGASYVPPWLTAGLNPALP